MATKDHKPLWRGWAPALALLSVVLVAGCGRSADDAGVGGVTVTRAQSTTASSAAAPTTTTAAPTTQATYVIQSGDSLSVIAERFGIKTAALAEFNAITDVNAIQVGQEIRIPPADFTASPTTTAAPAETTASS